jgi:DNA mismatch endonuclease (patch repair protein)
MSRIRSRGNWSTEYRLIQIMRRYKISGWRRRSTLPGKPDFVFRRAKLVVFVDGDFWHGNPKKFRAPKSNVEYWEQKINGNRARDREINRKLERLGWRVIRIWESSLADEEAIAAKIALCVSPIRLA